MTTVIPTEIMDKDGNLQVIEFYDELGSHVLDAVWDPTDHKTQSTAPNSATGHITF